VFYFLQEFFLSVLRFWCALYLYPFRVKAY